MQAGRDYSLTGKDVKIAVYDDMVEITSPGKLLPSIDFDDADAGQSDIRNKVIAPVFKRMGIIEQWGTGLKLIRSEMSSYPDIELRWSEPGMSFQVQFVKKYYVPEPEPEEEYELQKEFKKKPESQGQDELLYKSGQGKGVGAKISETLPQI